MKRTLWLLACLGALLLSAAPVPADDGFYVIAAGRPAVGPVSGSPLRNSIQDAGRPACRRGAVRSSGAPHTARSGPPGAQLPLKACNLGVRQIDQTFRGLTNANGDHLRSEYKKGVTPWGAAVKRQKLPSRLGTLSTIPRTLTTLLFSVSSRALRSVHRVVSRLSLLSRIIRPMWISTRTMWKRTTTR